VGQDAAQQAPVHRRAILFLVVLQVRPPAAAVASARDDLRLLVDARLSAEHL
jgi:hypothetical protein